MFIRYQSCLVLSSPSSPFSSVVQRNRVQCSAVQSYAFALLACLLVYLLYFIPVLAEDSESSRVKSSCGPCLLEAFALTDMRDMRSKALHGHDMTTLVKQRHQRELL